MHYVPGTALSNPHNRQFHLHDNPATVCTCTLQVRRQSTERPKNVSSHVPGGRRPGPRAWPPGSRTSVPTHSPSLASASHLAESGDHHLVELRRKYILKIFSCLHNYWGFSFSEFLPLHLVTRLFLKQNKQNSRILKKPWIWGLLSGIF